MGTLSAHTTRQEELFRFEYDERWLKTQSERVLDPHLRFYPGVFYPGNGMQNFGMFTDAAPGNWGKQLMQRWETALARKEKRTARMLAPSDFLLGVFDFYRAGALRFRLHPEGEFVTGDEQFILPSLSALRELEQTSLMAGEDNVNYKEALPAMEMLVASGAVLGGKRPKATVVDNDWQMWIAKFPEANDAVDVGGWEFVAHTMAGIAGILIAPGMIRKLTTHHHTFLAQRFDRTLKGERIHFASAMTLLGYSDTQRTPAGYLDIAELLMRHGAEVNSDLEELWRRMVFNIAICNTEDHLSNHGFLLTNAGWKLAPAYDLNPTPGGTGLSLNITEHDNSLDFDLALSVAKYFRVKPEKARSILQEIKLVKGQWRKIAADAGLSKTEQEKMSAAFEA